MSKPTPSSVTAEEAVARMINLDYIPEGFTLEDMLSAFREEAEVEFDNAKIDHLPTTQIEAFRIRFVTCTMRETLAKLLIEDFRNEINKQQDSAIARSGDSPSKPRYTLESIADWASNKYGIGIPEWSSDSVAASVNKEIPDDIAWDDIEIRIRKGNQVAYSFKQGEWKVKTYDEIGLLDRRKQEPNLLAGILLGLSQGKKFPGNRYAEAKDKTAISKLRRSLRTLIHIEGDPFRKFTETDGWKPQFRLTDDRRNADDRAREAAIHEELDDTRDYDDEDDQAGKWLQENQ